MKLLFDLPKKEQLLSEKELAGEKVLYSVPYDLNIKGSYVNGWVVITKDNFIVIENEEFMQKVKINTGIDYKLVSSVGNGMLQAEFNGIEKVIVKVSMEHLPRYTFIAKILELLSKGEIPRIVSDDAENKCPKCGRVYTDGSRSCSKCTNKKAICKRFVALIKPYRKQIAISLSLFGIITGLSIVNPVIYRKLIDGYLNTKNANGLAIFLLILSIAVCDITRTLVEIFKNRLMLKVGTGIARNLRKTVFEKLQSLSIAYLDTRQIGDLMNRITGDTNAIQQFISNQISMGINQMISLVVIAVILFVMNWKMALLILLPVPLISYLWKWMRRRFNKMYHNQWKIGDKANSILHDILSGIRVVKSFGMEEKEVKRFSETSLKLANITARNEKTYNTIFPILSFIMGLGNFLILLYGGQLILGKHMSLGELIQFTQYAGMIYGPLGWLTFFPRALTEATTATERIFEVLDEEATIKDLPNTITHDIKGSIRFDNLSFGYKSYEPILKNINLQVKAGEMIGLVGHSGSGKSTLINLVMRLYEADVGSLMIDGVDIKHISLKDLRSQIGVVLQETFLFSGTILQNITYAKPNATLEEVIKAAKIANAHDFIVKFQDGYDTKVGEKGYRLSGGERQRIAIARAILNDPKILILDEATASVDTETEYEIQEALGRLVKNRTTFAIAHRLSTLRNANRLLVLDKGTQIELGTHEELIKARGKYYSLVMAQRGIFSKNEISRDNKNIIP